MTETENTAKVNENTIELTGQMIIGIQRLANERRDAAISSAVGHAEKCHKDVAQALEKAKKKNWLPNHEKGAAAEFGVREWLKSNGIDFMPNFEDVDLDLGGAPDILIGKQNIKADVKATNFEFPEDQIEKIDRKQIVIWCDVFEDTEGYNTVLYRVTICGWSSVSDVRTAKKPHTGERQVRRVGAHQVYPIQKLLEWARSGSVLEGDEQDE